MHFSLKEGGGGEGFIADLCNLFFLISIFFLNVFDECFLNSKIDKNSFTEPVLEGCLKCHQQCKIISYKLLVDTINEY